MYHALSFGFVVLKSKAYKKNLEYQLTIKQLLLEGKVYFEYRAMIGGEEMCIISVSE
jgi:hypothetical protein